MKVVTNTSPLIFLRKLDTVYLLEKLFEPVLVPKGVIRELGDVDLPTFIHITNLSPPGEAFVNGALGRLHRGELEALALAQETRSDFVVLDDFLARQEAKKLGLGVIGTVGILLLAHKRKLVSSKELEIYLTDLVEKHGLYLSPELLAKVLIDLEP